LKTEKWFFDEVREQAERKYELRREKYGETWREMEFDALWDRFKAEEAEFHEATNDGDATAYNEVLDMINVLLMLAERTRLKDERLKR
jgi:hypothetical protein